MGDHDGRPRCDARDLIDDLFGVALDWRKARLRAYFDNVEPTTLAILFDFAHDLVRKVCNPRLRVAFAGANFFGIMR
jgi:hypothetical protein